MTAILCASGITKTYQGRGAPVHSLRGIDLDVAAGEFVAVMGASGSGKSTLLHVLAGLDRPTSGEVHLRGQRVDRLSEAKWAELRRREIGFVFQFFNLIGNLTAADNVELPALLAGCSAAQARRRRAVLLEQLGVTERARSIPSQLSGGEQQRVALARALVNEPALLLADEPTGNLDSRSTREVLALLRQCHAQGQTIVLVTHDPRVASIADRVLTMADGRIENEAVLAGRPDASAALSRLIQLEV
jgi:putative ABC transport system ATP-binding protein